MGQVFLPFGSPAEAPYRRAAVQILCFKHFTFLPIIHETAPGHNRQSRSIFRFSAVFSFFALLLQPTAVDRTKKALPPCPKALIGFSGNAQHSPDPAGLGCACIFYSAMGLILFHLASGAAERGITGT
ncbi:MAG: hypothetical protein PT958_00955 [Firmicutes bacterium]|nr:hypothetical protein [Bacillota bacterium]